MGDLSHYVAELNTIRLTEKTFVAHINSLGHVPDVHSFRDIAITEMTMIPSRENPVFNEQAACMLRFLALSEFVFEARSLPMPRSDVDGQFYSHPVFAVAVLEPVIEKDGRLTFDRTSFEERLARITGK